METLNKSAKTMPSRTRILLIAQTLALLAGCTVTPDQVHPQVASFDGDAQNSGVIAAMPQGGFNVTSHWRDRFNALALVYGTNFVPRITSDSGISPITNGTFVATSQAVANFAKMNLLYKSQPR